MGLITKQQAIDRLRLPLEIGSPASDLQSSMDRDLTSLMEQAEAQVLDWLKVSLVSPPDWDAEAGTVPKVIQLGTLIQLAYLWRFRGDDAASVDQAPKDTRQPGDLCQQAADVMYRWRDPAIA